MKAILLLLALFFSTNVVLAEGFTCKVVKVHDGDTFTCSDKTKIRIWGINCPEVSPKVKKAEPGGIEARNYLESYILNESLQCTKKGTSWKRIVAQCTLKNRDIARPLLEKGYAKELKEYSKGHYSNKEQ